MKIYVGCSLTQAPPEFRASVETLKDKLRAQGHKVFDFVGLVAGTASDVYRWDIHRCVANCDLFIAICDLPSIGLGYELGVAVEKYGKRVLAVANEDEVITRLVLGIDHPNFVFRRYKKPEDIIGFAQEIIGQDLQTEFDWGEGIAA